MVEYTRKQSMLKFGVGCSLMNVCLSSTETGQKFAVLELKIVLSHLLKNFTISCSYTHQQLTPSATIVLKSAEPYPIKLKRRHLAEQD